MTSDDDAFVFLDEQPETKPILEEHPWKIIVIDDDTGIIQTSKRILRDFTFENRGILVISGSSGAEAKELIEQHSDTAVMLLDVIMETDDAGLQVVTYIRDTLKNSQLRILLRTGQAGQFDEEEVFEKYDINDFLEKAELTSRRLKTAIKVGLRAFRMQQSIEKIMKKEQVLRQTADSANKAKSEFLANMSHELRSPMTSIYFGLSTIKEVLVDPDSDDEDMDDVIQAIGFAEKSADRLLGLLNEILDLAKLESGKMDFDFKPGNLNEVITQACQEISTQIDQKSLIINSKLLETDTIITMDFGKMIQVIINLLNNAVKFSPEGSTISISIEHTIDPPDDNTEHHLDSSYRST